jgi:hypothetical protein
MPKTSARYQSGTARPACGELPPLPPLLRPPTPLGSKMVHYDAEPRSVTLRLAVEGATKSI